MAPLPRLVYCSLWGIALIALGLIPGLFRRLVSAVAEFISVVGSTFFASPPVLMRNDCEHRDPLWLAFAGLALIAAGVAQYLLA